MQLRTDRIPTPLAVQQSYPSAPIGDKHNLPLGSVRAGWGRAIRATRFRPPHDHVPDCARSGREVP